MFLLIFLQRLYETLTGALSPSAFPRVLVGDWSSFLWGPWGQLLFFIASVFFLSRAVSSIHAKGVESQRALSDNQNRIERSTHEKISQIEHLFKNSASEINNRILEVVRPANRIEGLKVLRGSLQDLESPLSFMEGGIRQLESFRIEIFENNYNDHEIQINYRFSSIFDEFNQGQREVAGLLKTGINQLNLNIKVQGRLSDDGGHSFSVGDNPYLAQQIDSALSEMRTSFNGFKARAGQIKSNIIAVASELANDLKTAQEE